MSQGMQHHRAPVLAIIVATAVSIGSATSAASQTLVECVGTDTTQYSPGLLLTPQPVVVTLTRVYAPCLSPTDPSLTSATVLEVFPRTLSCLTLLGGGPVSLTLNWNTGEFSEWQATSVVENIGGILVITLTGAIIEGKFAGATAVGTHTAVAPPLLPCLAPPGHTQSQGLATLTIVSTASP